jgi:cell wall-associated NlpC family hydrolase
MKRMFMRKKLAISIFIVQLAAIALTQEFEVVFDDEPVSRVNRTTDKVTSESVTPDDIIRVLITEKAREYIGVNYLWGQSHENGFDCSGYVKFVFDQFGYKLPRSSYDQYKSVIQLKEKKAKPGDLVFFTTRGHRVSHVGIYLGNRSFIHAPSKGKQVCIESLETAFFKERLTGFGTILMAPTTGQKLSVSNDH